MISSTMLALIVIPAIYSLWQEWRLGRETEPVPAEPALAGGRATAASAA